MKKFRRVPKQHGSLLLGLSLSPVHSSVKGWAMASPTLVGGVSIMVLPLGTFLAFSI